MQETKKERLTSITANKERKDVMLIGTFYDFTNYTAGESYRKLEGMEKYFVYKLWAAKDWKYEGAVLFDKLLEKRNDMENNGVFKGLCDPDSKCPLLQVVYKQLWEDEYLKHCIKDSVICGETMNSVQTTLNRRFECLKDEDIKSEIDLISEKKKEIKPKAKKAEMSIKLLLNRYYKVKNNNDKLKKFKNQCGNAGLLISIYHSLGNFIPFPVDCNSPRGTGPVKDYWDLTLKYIYDYYHSDEKAIGKIYTDKKNEEAFIEWLDEFGKWDIFVEKNYMSAFVNKNEDDTASEKYGMPKELWTGHFNGEPLPQSASDCDWFFYTAMNCIIRRGTEMRNRLRNIKLVL